MTVLAPPLAVDPLIAEAKARARRRWLLLLVSIVVVAAAAVGMTHELRSNGNSLGVCATSPPGFKQRAVTGIALAPPTVVLTNWRFGRMAYLLGFGDPRLNWPQGGVTVAVENEGPPATGFKAGPLRVVRSEFGAFEGVRKNFASISVASHGSQLTAYVEVGAITPATIAAANQALADVRVCSS